MLRNSLTYQTYVQILKRELVCAMGCTEPIALAYCAAKARSVLGCIPDRIRVEASGNIIKNVKSVVVPNTCGRKGIAAAVAAGILGGDENAYLQVISQMPDRAKEQLPAYIDKTPIEIVPLESDCLLDMIVTVFQGSSSASVRIANEHTNIVRIERNGRVLFEKDVNEAEDAIYSRDLTDVTDILKEMLRDEKEKKASKQVRES